MTLRYEIKKNKYNSCGLSLAEASVVLLVIGAIIASLWTVVGSVRNMASTEHMVSLIAQTVQGTRDVFKGYAATPSGDLTHMLINRSAVPDELIRSRSGTYTAGHLWDSGTAGGNFTIRSANSGWAANNSSAYFEIRLSGLDREICVQLAGLVTGEAGPDGLESTRINFGSEVSGVITPEIAASSCGLATSNTLRFYYRLRQKGR